MAYRVKEIALLLLVCALAGAATRMLHLDPGPRVWYGDRVASTKELDRLRYDVRRLNATLRRFAIADTVERLLSVTAAPIVVSPAGGLGASLGIAAKRQIGPDSLNARLGILRLSDAFGSYNRQADNRQADPRSPASEFVFGSVNGEPWCAAVHYDIPQTSDSDEWMKMRLLGPCAFWVRYGAPSAPLQQWLAEGGFRFAQLPVDNQELDVQPQGSFFSNDRVKYWGHEALAGCLTGRASVCRNAFLEATESGRWFRAEALPDAPLTYARYRYDSEIFGYIEGTLMAQMEKDFGGTRFAQFWKSNEPLEQAFASAFGTSLDNWVRTWAQARYGVEPTGPRISLMNLLMSLVVTGAFMGVALLIVQRREAR